MSMVPSDASKGDVKLGKIARKRVSDLLQMILHFMITNFNIKF